MRRAIIALCLLAAVVCEANPRRLLMARHRSGAVAGGTVVPYIDADPDDLMQYCKLWLDFRADVDPSLDVTDSNNDMDQSASGLTHETSGDDAWFDFDDANGLFSQASSNATYSGDQSGTIMMWIRSASLSSDETVFSEGGDNTAFLRWSINSSGQVRVLSSIGVPNRTSAEGVTQGAWHHVALTSSGTEYRTYIDGVETILTGTGIEGAWFGDILTDQNRKHYVGALEYNGTVQQHFGGDLDDVAYFSYVMNSNELANVVSYGPYN